jgi:hypothetical protein
MLDMNTKCNPGAFSAFDDKLQAPPIEPLFRALLMLNVQICSTATLQPRHRFIFRSEGGETFTVEPDRHRLLRCIYV